MNVVNTAQPDLRFTSEVQSKTAHFYEKVKNVIPEVEWPVFAP